MDGCKISYFNTINMYPRIHSKLSYMSSQIGVSLRMNAQPSNQTGYDWLSAPFHLESSRALTLAERMFG